MENYIYKHMVHEKKWGHNKIIVLPEGNSGIRVWLWNEGLMGSTRRDLSIANLTKSIKMIIQIQVYNIRPHGTYTYKHEMFEII